MVFTDHSLKRAHERINEFNDLSEYELKRKLTNLINNSDYFFEDKTKKNHFFVFICESNHKRLFALIKDDGINEKVVITIKIINYEQEQHII